MLFSHYVCKIDGCVAFGCSRFFSLWYYIPLCEHASLSNQVTDIWVVCSFLLLWMVVQWAFLWFPECAELSLGFILKCAIAGHRECKYFMFQTNALFFLIYFSPNVTYSLSPIRAYFVCFASLQCLQNLELYLTYNKCLVNVDEWMKCFSNWSYQFILSFFPPLQFFFFYFLNV